MEIKKIVGPVLAALVVVGVIAAGVVSANHKTSDTEQSAAAGNVVEVMGVVGSEKSPYFADAEVQAEYLSGGFTYRVDKLGSREISSRVLTGYDFGFPAGEPAAMALQKKVKAKQVYPIFFTPMAVASWKALIPTLQKEGIVQKIDAAYYIIDMKKLLSKIADGARWDDLAENTAFKTSASILITSTDVRKSNSAGMYLSLASYVLNGNNIMTTDEQIAKMVPQVAPLFMRQGLQEGSSSGPFDDYTMMGMGKAPLVMVYESQFLEYQSKRANPDPEMVLLYPKPTIFTKHVMVPFTENGRRFAEFTAASPRLQALAAKYGYRTANPEQFAEFVKTNKLSAPLSIVDVVNPPSYEVLEKMIVAISQKF